MPVNEIVACGGLPERNQLLMRIFADVTGREIAVAASSQTPALGSAMFAAVAAGSAAGGYDTIEEAAARMAHLSESRYRPDPVRARTSTTSSSREYRALHDHFGRGGDDVMKRLRALRDRGAGAADRAVGRLGQPDRRADASDARRRDASRRGSSEARRGTSGSRSRRRS